MKKSKIGRPPKPDNLKTVPVGYRIPKWLDDWLKSLPKGKQNRYIKNAIIRSDPELMRLALQNGESYFDNDLYKTMEEIKKGESK